MRHSHPPQLLPAPHILRHCESDERPEGGGVVELDEMAELMDDEIVGEMRRKEDNFIIKIEIAPARTAPSTRLLITDAHAPVRERAVSVRGPVYLCEMFKPSMDERPRGFFVQKKCAAGSPPATLATTTSPHTATP